MSLAPTPLPFPLPLPVHIDVDLSLSLKDGSGAVESEVLDSCLSLLELAIIERISSKIEERKVGMRSKEMI